MLAEGLQCNWHEHNPNPGMPSELCALCLRLLYHHLHQRLGIAAKMHPSRTTGLVTVFFLVLQCRMSGQIVIAIQKPTI
jgi:hypothetical protein